MSEITQFVRNNTKIEVIENFLKGGNRAMKGKLKKEALKIRAIITIFIVVLFAFGIHQGAECATPVDGYIYLGKISVKIEIPDRLAIDESGNLYVIDAREHKIRIFDWKGNFSKEIKYKNASAVAVAPGGRLYLGANGSSPSVAIYEGGKIIGYLGAGPGEFGSVNDIAVDKATGDVYVVNSIGNKVSVYSSAGVHLRDITGLYLPVAVDVAGGEVYVIDSPVINDPTGTTTTGARVSVYDTYGNLLRRFDDALASGGHMVRPQDITVDHNGYILIPEAISQAVLVYDGSGLYIGEIKDASETLKIPRSAVIGPDKRLFVSSNMTKSILVFGLAGYTYMDVTPLQLSFRAQGDVAPSPQGINITNTGVGILNYTVAASAGWIQLSATSGVLNPGASSSIDVGINPAGLAPGTYNGNVTITSDAGITETVSVQLEVLPKPTLAVSPVSLSFTAPAGGANPASQALIIEIKNDINGIINWTATADSGWLSISPGAGAGVSITQALVSVNISGLAAGTYNGNIVVNAPGTSTGQVTVPVTLDIYATGVIHVTTNLDEATFTITGPVNYQGSGKDWTVNNVPDGTYTITYSDVSGYITPPSETKTITGGGILEFNGRYEQQQAMTEYIVVTREKDKHNPTVIRIFDGDGNLMKEFEAFPGEKGGIDTVVADVDGDGSNEIIAGLLKKGSLVGIFRPDGAEVTKFEAFDDKDGVMVAAGDLNGDGIDEIIVAGEEDQEKIRIFEYAGGSVSVIAEFETDNKEDSSIASGDVDGDGIVEIVTLADDGKKIKVWKLNEANKVRLINEIKLNEDGEDFEIEDIKDLAVADSNNEGSKDIVLVASKKVLILNGAGEILNIINVSKDARTVAVGDVNDDGIKEVVVGKKHGSVEVYTLEGVEVLIFQAVDTKGNVRVSTGYLGL